MSFPEPVLRNLFATAFTVFILPSLLCFTTVLTGTWGTAEQPVFRGGTGLSVAVVDVGERERLEKYLQSVLLSRDDCIFLEKMLCP